MLILFLCELRAFLTPEVYSTVAIDSNQDSKVLLVLCATSIEAMRAVYISLGRVGRNAREKTTTTVIHLNAIHSTVSVTASRVAAALGAPRLVKPLKPTPLIALPLHCGRAINKASPCEMSEKCAGVRDARERFSLCGNCARQL